MPNGARKQNAFDAATSVMESGLLRALTDKSSSTDDDHESERAREPEPQIEIVVEPAVAVEAVTAPPSAAPHGSRVFVVAGIVAAVVLAFDASLFVYHQRRAMRPAAAPSAPEPLPRYMLVPLASSAPPAPARSETAQPAATPAPPPAPALAPPLAAAPAPPPATTAAVATAIVDAPRIAVHTRRHSHHRHATH